MSNIKKKCFVCNRDLDSKNLFMNIRLNLPVCEECKGTENEQQAEKEAIESLADGFVCGCI